MTLDFSAGGTPLDEVIDPSRPALDNQDGSISTERTITVERDGRHYLVPTIVGGRQLSEQDAALAWYDGKNPEVGGFATADEADAAAKRRSDRIGQKRAALDFSKQGTLVQDAQPPVDKTSGEDATVSTAMQRGFGQVAQGAHATVASANARALNAMDRIDRGERVLDAEDPVGYQYMDPEQRKASRAKLEVDLGESLKGVARHAQTVESIAQAPAVKKLTQAKTFGEVWDAFKSDPVTIVAHLGAESLPGSAPGMLLGGVAGKVMKAAGVAAGMGAGSYGIEYASDILDGLRDAGVDVQDTAALTAAVRDSALMERVRKAAHAKAVVVGALDAASGAVAANKLVPAKLAAKPIAGELANAVVQAPVQGALGAAGEAAGSVAAGKPVEPGAVAAEFLGEFAGTPAEIVSAAGARHPAAAPVVSAERVPVPARPVPPDPNVVEFQPPAPHEPGAGMELAPRNQPLAPGGPANGVDFNPPPSPLDRAGAVESAVAAETARQAEAARVIPYTPENVDQVRSNLALAPDLEATHGNEIDIHPFLQERALMRANGITLADWMDQGDMIGRKFSPETVDLMQRIDALANADPATAARVAGIVDGYNPDKETPSGTAEKAATAAPSDASTAGTRAQDRVQPETASAPAESPAAGAQVGTLDFSAHGTPEVDHAAHAAATSPQNDRPEPTPAQKEAGNYAKGHVIISGVNISIENPAGSKRKPEWPTMKSHYGYIRGTVGKDKDHVDVFVKPATPADYTGPVYVVDQVTQRGAFDEHKVVLGAANLSEARSLYSENYSKGFKVGPVTEMTFDQFRAWTKSDFTKRPVKSLSLSEWQAITKEPVLDAARLRSIEGEIGWAETGGRLIREADTGGQKPEVVGRTSWIAKSDFWPGRPDGVTEADARSALDKAQQGEKLNAAETRFIEYARKWMDAQDHKAAAPAEEKVSNDRRRDASSRQRVAEMSQDEMRKALLTDDLTGLGNRRAYEESTKRAVQGSLDVDSLKWINDNLNHQAGDELLRAVGQALREEGIDAYHVSGDEFVVQFDHEEGGDAALARVRDRLDRATVTALMPDGSKITKQGVGFSYGLGPTLQEAEAGLQSDKSEREWAGARAGRGEPPAGVARQSPDKAGGDLRDASAQDELEPAPAPPETPAPAGVSASGPAKYRRTTADVAGMDAQPVRDHLRAITSKLRVRVEVVQSVPEGHPSDAAGYYDNGRIVLVADNLRDLTDAERRLAHELVHAGLDARYGADLAGLEVALRDLATKNPHVRAIADAWAKQHGAEFVSDRIRDGMKPAMASRVMNMVAMNEGLAYRGESLPTLNGWKSFVAALQKWLRSMGLTRLADSLESATQAETIAFIAELRDALERPVAAPAHLQPAFARTGEEPGIFYSELARQVAAAKTESAPAPQWSATLKGMKGVKADELEWSGVLDWLATREGKVTKAEVQQFLDQNGVQVEETMLGGEGESANEAASAAAAIAHEHAGALARELQAALRAEEVNQVNRANLGHWAMAAEDPTSFEDERASANEKIGSVGLSEAAEAKLRDWARAGLEAQRLDVRRLRGELQGGGETKFKAYTLPGGKNYRELLLTLPSHLEMPPGFEVFEDRPGDWGVKFPDGNRLTGWRTREAAILSQRKQDGSPVFASSHFDQPNILAHVRFNERTDAEGKKVLFIEEIQSDWAQKGKREGFATGAEPTHESVAREVYGRPYDALDRATRSAVDDELDARLHGSGGAAPKTSGQIPLAPFVGKTEAWVSLAVKRMIRYAVDNGFDRVAYTTGEQQVDRYDLSRHIDELQYVPSTQSLRARKNGGLVFDRTVPPDALPDHIGKDASKKLLESPIKPIAAGRFKNIEKGEGHELSGIDLKIGGEGMRSFYDKIVPNVVNDVLKKLGGGRAGKVEIAADFRDSGTRNLQVNTFREEMLTKYGDGIKLKMTAEELARLHALEDGRAVQPGFDITPEMRAQAAGPLPLFARTSANLPPLAFPGTNAPSGVTNAPKSGTNPPAGGTKAPSGGTPAPRPGTWNAPGTTRLDDVIYRLQDKHVDMRRVVKAIELAHGPITDATDPYLNEGLYHGRTAKAVDDFLDTELSPLIKDMATRGVAIADFEEWLHARHAQERNAQIAQINPQLPDGGSGMTNADAAAVLARARANGMATAYQALAVKVDAINDVTRQALVNNGLEAPATVAAWQQAYKHYVPLQREDMESPGMGTGQGFSIRGNATKRATGSTRAVVDILANIAQQRERVIVRAEKARVGRALLGLAQANPNPDFWRVDQPPKVTRVDPRTGLVTSTVDPLYKSRDNVLVVPVPDGAGNVVDHAVVFNEHNERAVRMAQAIKNLDMDQLSGFLGLMGRFTRFFAAINTQWNPVFGVVNLTRDVQDAMLNLTTTAIAGKQAQVLAHVPSALRGVYADLRAARSGGQAQSTWGQLFEEFQREGGKTAYRDTYATAASRTEAIAAELAKLNAPAWRLDKPVVDAIGGWLSDYNDSMENAVRLSAYKVAVDSGLSKPRAAMLAKDLTVNFNRKGQATTQMAALYAFFNASVQGTTRTLQTLTGPAGKQIIAGGVLLGMLQAIALSAAGFDDGEPPDFEREKNLIIPIGNKKYVKIAMPQGFLILPNLGRLATEYWIGGFKNGAKKLMALGGVLADAANPVGNAGWSAQTLAPTVLDPFVALSENRDWSGRPIAREDFNKLHPTPGHKRAKDVASAPSRWASEAINALTGGTAHKPGMWSPTPDQLDYLAGQFTGGVGREITKGFTTGSAMVTGEKLPPYKIPLVGRFYGDAESASSTSHRFYENLKELNEHGAEIKGRMQAGEPLGDYLRANPEARLAEQARSVERQVADLRHQKKLQLDKGAPKDRIEAIDEQIARRQERFNEVVKKARGG